MMINFKYVQSVVFTVDVAQKITTSKTYLNCFLNLCWCGDINESCLEVRREGFIIIFECTVCLQIDWNSFSSFVYFNLSLFIYDLLLIIYSIIFRKSWLLVCKAPTLGSGKCFYSFVFVVQFVFDEFVSVPLCIWSTHHFAIKLYSCT